MGRTNYLQSASGRYIQKSNSDDETKRYLNGKLGRNASKSSSSSSTSNKRVKFLDRRPPRTAIPEIGRQDCRQGQNYLLTKKSESDDLFSISKLIGHQGFAEQTIYFSRQEDCQPGQSYLVQKKTGCDSDQSDCYYGRTPKSMTLEQLCSPCSSEHTFLVTRCSRQRLQRMTLAARPKVSTVSTSTDEVYSSSGTIGETIIGSEPEKVDASRSLFSVSGFQFFEMSLKLSEKENASACTISSPRVETIDASTVTDIKIGQQNANFTTGTQSDLRLIGVSEFSKCLDQTDNSKAATDIERQVHLTTGTQSDLIFIGVPDSRLNLTENSEVAKHTSAQEKSNVTEGTQTDTYTVGIMSLSKGETQGTSDNTEAALEKTPGNQAGLQQKDCQSPELVSIKYSKILEIFKKPVPRSSKARKKSKEGKPKNSENQQKGRLRKRGSSTERARKSSKNRGRLLAIPKKIHATEENIRKCSENEELNKDVPLKIHATEDNVRPISEHKELNKGASRRFLSVECIPKSSENVRKGLHKKGSSAIENRIVTQDGRTIEEKVNAEKTRSTSSRSETVTCRDQLHSPGVPTPSSAISDTVRGRNQLHRPGVPAQSMKNNSVGEMETANEPKKGILQSVKKSNKSSVRFLDKEVLAKVDNEEKASLTDSFVPPPLEQPKRKIPSVNKGTQLTRQVPEPRSPAADQEVTGCRKFVRNIRKCLTCQCC
nr:uncharacterized protein LOC106682932 isoform X3 [Halyomorpha halys]